MAVVIPALSSCCSGLGMAYMGSCVKPSRVQVEAGQTCAEPGMLTRDAKYVRCMDELGIEVHEDPSATQENEHRRSNKGFNRTPESSGPAEPGDLTGGAG